MGRRVPALITPSVLEWSIGKSGFSLEEISQRLKIPKNRMEKWEVGLEKPTINQVRKIGKLFKRPLAFFYLPNPPQDFDAIHDYRRIAGQEPFQENPDLLFAIRAARDRRSIAIELMEELGEGTETYVRQLNINDEPEKLALEIRDDLNVSDKIWKNWSSYYDALNFWRESLETRNILVFQFGDVDRNEARGFSIGDFPLPVIAANRSEVPQARIFSLIHEYVHIMLRQSGLCDFIEFENAKPEEQKIEIFCNRVAGAVLVPIDKLIKEYELRDHKKGNELDESKIRSLSKKFKVSREVILRRLLIFDYISKQFYEQKKEEYSKENYGKSNGFSPPYRIAISSGGHLYTKTVLKGYYSEKITASDLSEFLGVKMKHIPQIEKIVFRKSRIIEI